MFDHVGLLTEAPVADVALEGLLAGVDFEMLFEVEPLGVDEEAADWTAFVLRPVVVHVDVEVVQAGQDRVALDAVNRPIIVLNLGLILAHLHNK